MIDGFQKMHVATEPAWRRAGGCRGELATPHPHVQLDREAMRRLLGAAVLDSEVLMGGLRNTNYKLRLAGEDRPVVLRLHTAVLMRLVGERVPVPRVLRANPHRRPTLGTP